ncbi:MAG TPA: DMT family transporter [Steroidobacteraceae bacterium]|nr:DMT family transporter [Steroidobacteraceae bacterium]
MAERAARLRGILLMIAAVGVFGVMDALMKFLVAHYPPMQIACLRGASSLPFVFATCALTGRLADLRPRRLQLHAIRAVVSIAMLWLFVFALSRMSLANTYAITLSAPLLVVPCAVLLLGERADRHVWAAILVGLCGVLVALNPSMSGFAAVAGLAALGAALCWAVVVVMVRLLSTTETTASMVFWFLLLLSAGAGALAAPGWVGILRADLPWIALLGFAGWTAQHLVTEAFRLAPAATVAPFEYLSIAWGACIDWIVWSAVPGARVLAGAGIVVGAGLYLVHRERMRT